MHLCFSVYVCVCVRDGVCMFEVLEYPDLSFTSQIVVKLQCKIRNAWIFGVFWSCLCHFLCVWRSDEHPVVIRR